MDLVNKIVVFTRVILVYIQAELKCILVSKCRDLTGAQSPCDFIDTVACFPTNKSVLT